MRVRGNDGFLCCRGEESGWLNIRASQGLGLGVLIQRQCLTVTVSSFPDIELCAVIVDSKPALL